MHFDLMFPIMRNSRIKRIGIYSVALLDLKVKKKIHQDLVFILSFDVIEKKITQISFHLLFH